MKAASCFVFICLLLSRGAIGQSVTASKTVDSLRKGFYRTYQEYLSNAPSVITDFTVQLYSASKQEPMIVSGEYKLADPAFNTGEIWGFSDGENVFVASGTLFVLKYWKLQCRGPNPYLFYAEKKILFPLSIAGVLASAINLTMPQNYQLMLIDKAGRPRQANDYQVKRVIRDNPELLKQFKQEYFTNSDLIIKYLQLYNEYYQFKNPSK